MTAHDDVVNALAGGVRVSVVKAPPGGGKSTLIAQIAATLTYHYGLDLTIATPTRAQSANMARKLLDVMPSGHVRLDVSDMVALSEDSRFLPEIYVPAQASVSIRTLDSLRLSRRPPRGSLVIVDEAFQAAYALGASAARTFDQILAVGDPGQIGPVIPVATDALDAAPLRPHRPFAEQLMNLPHTFVTHLDATYRLGPMTTELLSPLYDFGFVSRRAPMHVAGLPEISASLATDVVASATQRARDLVGLPFVSDSGTRSLTPRDIAVVTSLRVHTAETEALLRDTPGFTVGTADQLQGGQWPCVIAIDPLAASALSDHHVNIGRLCVMLSRHLAHVHLITTPTWAEGLSTVSDSPQIHHDLRTRLLAPHHT